MFYTTDFFYFVPLIYTKIGKWSETYISYPGSIISTDETFFPNVPSKVLLLDGNEYLLGNKTDQKRDSPYLYILSPGVTFKSPNIASV